MKWQRVDKSLSNVGTVGNEKADELAKAGALGNNSVIVSTPLVDIKNKVKEHFYKIWTNNFTKGKGKVHLGFPRRV